MNKTTSFSIINKITSPTLSKIQCLGSCVHFGQKQIPTECSASGYVTFVYLNKYFFIIKGKKKKILAEN